MPFALIWSRSRRAFFPAICMMCGGLILLSLPGCMTAAVTAGTSAGVAAAEERSISDNATDQRIRLEISNLWFKKSVEIFRKLDLTVNEGKVLITGKVQKLEDKMTAVQLAWDVPGVRQVIDEIQVGSSSGVSGYAKDSWIVLSLRTSMIADKQIVSINYTIDSVDGKVYLMGIAQNNEERQRLINLARNVSGVRDVVSYVRLRTEGR